LLAGGSLSTPFFIAAGMSLLSLVLIALLLPESLPRENRSRMGGGLHFINIRSLFWALKSPIGFLLFLAFFATFGTSNFEAIYSLYMAQKLEYPAERIGLILTVVGAIALIGRGLLTGLFTKRWGEQVVIKAALPAAALGFFLLLSAGGYPMVLFATGFFSFAVTFLRPSIHSLTSQFATVGQGTAMGWSNSFVSLGRIVGALWAGMLFDLGMDYPYWSGVVILLIACLLAMFRLRREPDAQSLPR
jgi:DHA1 family multidrug resistance protein-like MFS transporter